MKTNISSRKKVCALIFGIAVLLSACKKSTDTPAPIEYSAVATAVEFTTYFAGSPNTGVVLFRYNGENKSVSFNRISTPSESDGYLKVSNTDIVPSDCVFVPAGATETVSIKNATQPNTIEIGITNNPPFPNSLLHLMRTQYLL